MVGISRRNNKCDFEWIWVNKDSSKKSISVEVSRNALQGIVNHKRSWMRPSRGRECQSRIVSDRRTFLSCQRRMPRTAKR